MPRRQTPPLPHIWLVSDARNDASLELALKRLPRGSGLIFRHYHLPAAERRTRYAMLAQLARRRGHVIVLAGSVRQARAWRADGAYGAPAQITRGGPALRLATAHGLRELRQANRADAVLLSPVFATRSHLGAPTLGPLRFRLLAARMNLPVIALGGMDANRARHLCWPSWAAIDSFCDEATRQIFEDS